MNIDPRLLQRLMVPGPVGPTQLPPGFRPPGAPPGAPMMQPPPMMQPTIPGFGMGMRPNPGEAAQRAANANEPAVQANPGTSAAGMLAGTNPDVGIGGGMPAPPDGGTGIGVPAAGGPGGGSFAQWLRGLF